jgi:hypothetical protein
LYRSLALVMTSSSVSASSVKFTSLALGASIYTILIKHYTYIGWSLIEFLKSHLFK